MVRNKGAHLDRVVHSADFGIGSRTYRKRTCSRACRTACRHTAFRFLCWSSWWNFIRRRFREKVPKVMRMGWVAVEAFSIQALQDAW